MRHHEFHDFDAFAESIRDIDARMILVKPKRHYWTSSGANLAGVDVQAGQLGSGNLGQAQLRDDGYFFYLPTTPGVRYLANGQLLPFDSFAVIQPAGEFCISTQDPHDWNAVFLPKELLEQHVVDPTSFFKGSRCRLTREDDKLANRLRSIVREVMFAASQSSQFESSIAAEIAAAEILKLAASALEKPVVDRSSERGRPTISRQEIVQVCMAHLEEHPRDPVAVSELATLANVSERTLRTAFNQYFGVGPTRYLLTRQLHQVHRALSDSDPAENTVTSLLNEHGVWECGRFAAKYREQFGELPSVTLKKQKTNNRIG